MTRCCSLLSAFLVFAAVAGAPTYADARYDNGYICKVRYSPWTGFGDFGGIEVQLYSRPNCEGKFVRSGIFVSNDASPFYIANTVYVYTNAALFAALFTNLLHAKISGIEVKLGTEEAVSPQATTVQFQ